MQTTLSFAARAGILTCALLAPASAQAFCGTYVGQPGDELYSGASEVVLARSDGRTVLTLSNDVEGDVSDFAMLIPVPEVLSEDDVKVVDRAVLDRVREYAGPRLVAYECSDLSYDRDTSAMSCGGCTDQTFSADSAVSGPPSLDVTVEAQFAAGEYDIVILSSEDSSDLLTWLDREGYGVSSEAESLLAEYIEADSKFMAAKVRLDDVPTSSGPEGRPFLTPLQIAYDSEAASLPIRLGTVNSPGSQDLILYTLTSSEDGEMAIANYPEAELETDCLFEESANGSLADYLDGMMDDAVQTHDGVAWAKTYSWTPAWCDPCPEGGSLEDEIVSELGFPGGANGAHLTRLWMRYDADAVREDLSLYATHMGNAYQLRYIQRKPGLEQYFPVCEIGWVEDYPACEDASDEPQRSGVAPWWLGVSMIGLLAGLGALLRRRS